MSDLMWELGEMTRRKSVTSVCGGIFVLTLSPPAGVGEEAQ